MGNLDVDGFDTATFENHATALLRQILSGRQRMAAITSKETQLMAHKQLLQRVDGEFEPSLRAMIDEMQTFVHPSDLALFVIAAKRTELIPQAQEILDSVRQERRLMSLNDLLGALASTSDMPGSWAASLFGEMDAERDSTPQLEVKKATIDLAAMHRGMGL
jgi:hypothetical protein